MARLAVSSDAFVEDISSGGDFGEEGVGGIEPSSSLSSFVFFGRAWTTADRAMYVIPSYRDEESIQGFVYCSLEV